MNHVLHSQYGARSCNSLVVQFSCPFVPRSANAPHIPVGRQTQGPRAESQCSSGVTLWCSSNLAEVGKLLLQQLRCQWCHCSLQHCLVRNPGKKRMRNGQDVSEAAGLESIQLPLLSGVEPHSAQPVENPALRRKPGVFPERRELVIFSPCLPDSSAQLAEPPPLCREGGAQIRNGTLRRDTLKSSCPRTLLYSNRQGGRRQRR